jgi:hypothetical protein
MPGGIAIVPSMVKHWAMEKGCIASSVETIRPSDRLEETVVLAGRCICPGAQYIEYTTVSIHHTNEELQLCSRKNTPDNSYAP